jgi:hypothetical protein
MSKLLRVARLSKSAEIRTAHYWRMPVDQRPIRFRVLDAMRDWAAVVILFHQIFVDGP